MTSFLSLSLPSFRVSLLSASIPCCAIVDSAPVIARPPAAVPGAGCVACRGPAPGLPTSSPMPRGPPPRAPAPFPGFSIPNGNRLCADSFASVGPSAPPGPGFHVRWPPSGPRVSARAIPVSADWRSLPAPAGASGKNSRYFHTLKGMKQTHKGMKNHCFSRKHVFHTLKKHFIPLCNCCIP